MPAHTGDLLIASPARWDECCFSVPAVRALLESGWEIGLLCTPAQRTFWETLPGLRIVVVSEKESVRSLAKRLCGSWRSALVWEDGQPADAIRKAAIPRTIGPQGARWAKWLSHPLDLSQRPKEHRVEFYLSAARLLGRERLDPAWFAPVDGLVGERTDSLLLVPDSDFGPSHEWPLDCWRELARHLEESGRALQVADLSTGRGWGMQLARQLGQDGAISIDVSASALSLLSGYRTLIAADGSLSHLASHVGVNCLTLFGPNEVSWKRPLGRRHLVLHRHVECAPCFLPRCPLDHRCQRELAVEHVWRAFLEWSAAH